MIYFIVNNTARTGKSRAIWLEMKELLENRSIEYKAYQTKYAGHATELARKIFFSTRRQDLSDHRRR